MSEHYKETTKEHRGHTITLKWFFDQDSGEPWKECDGHGPVSDWTTRDKVPGELVLYSDRRSYRYYDYAEAMKLAKKDGWGLCPEAIAKLESKLGRPPTKGEIRHASVMSDFEYLRRWCNNDWHWCGYMIDIEGTKYGEGLWGIDSDSQDYFEKEAFESAIAWLDRELTEENRAACSDIATVNA